MSYLVCKQCAKSVYQQESFAYDEECAICEVAEDRDNWKEEAGKYALRILQAEEKIDHLTERIGILGEMIAKDETKC